MRRYEIRSEYGLGDPEVYKSGASEDDPESILEGVAMAGLVGLLRQLGDLAQFAAEIFHDLHEEAMATSARSHGLMVRVQQLEAEFPEIEKAFLTKTDHSSFFSNPGVEWHPNLRTEQNLITRGDLPRFVMDSYEECRGPPRLFLLDKYDVAGAGACLKRYTDPSVFKLEAVSTGIANVDVQKEKKSRKVKKKGSRWRNGGTPDIRPSSHAKLHQLLLEERIQNNWSEPARSVKLKRRQYNDLTVDSKTGKSYMEKFIQNSSHENGTLCDASVCPLPLKFASESSSDSGHDIVDIGTVSPLKSSSPTKVYMHFSPAMHEVSKPSGNITNHEIIDAPQSTVDGEEMDRPSALCDMISEEEFAGDGESKTGDSGYDDHSEDSPSEIENYMDALATMESEIDTDNEYRLNRGMSLSKANTHQRDSDANEEGSYIQAQYSDSQSLGNFSATDDGNGSVKRGESSISYSDTRSTVAEIIPPDTIAAVQLFPSSKAGIAESVHMPLNQCTASVEVPGDQSHNISQSAVYISEGEIHEFGESSMISPDNTFIEKDGIANVGELAYDACIPDSKYIHDTTDFELATNTDDYVANLGTSIISSSIPTQSKDDASVLEFTEVCAVDQLSDGHSKSSSGALPWRSRNVDTYHAKESSNDKVVQRESASESTDETLVCEKTRLPQSTIMGPKEQLASSSSREIKAVSGILVSLNLESSTPNLETPLTDNSGRQKLMSDVDSAEEVVFCETSRVGDMEQTNKLPSNAAAVQVDLSHNSVDHRDVNSNNDITEKAVVKDIDISTSVTSEDLLLESSHTIHSQDLDIKQEPPCSFEDPECRGWESDDIISVERCKESAEQMDSKLEISPSDGETDHCERQTLDTCDNNCSQSGAQETTGVFSLDDDTTVFASSQANCMDPELIYVGHECNPESGGDDKSYSTFHLTDHAVSSIQSPELPADEFKLKHSQADESTSNSMLHDREMKSIDCANLEEQNDASVKLSSDKFKAQPSPLQFSSETAIDPIDGTPTSGLCTEKAGENDVSSSAELLTQPSACDVPSQSDNQELAGTKLITPSLSLNHDTGYLHKGTQLNQASSQSSSDGFQLQLAQSESLLQSVGMEVAGNKHLADELDSIHPNFPLLQGKTQDSHVSSNTSQLDIISYSSSPELLLPTSNLEGGGIQQAAHGVNFSMHCIVLPPVAPNISIEDVPPLPPLPPMQWRMGKMQNTPQNSEKESFERSGISLTSSMLQQSIEGESQFGAGDSVHPLPPAFPLNAAEDMNCQRRPESFPNNLVPLNGISRQSSDKISVKNSPTTEELLSSKPFLAEQPMSNEEAKDSGTSESASPLQSGHSSFSPTENLAATDSETKTVLLNVQNSKEQRNLPDTSVEGEQLQNCMQISDGEMVHSWDSSSEFAASEVGKPKKIPRPRSPLIDAVAAHDRSTLRKVTERVQPQDAPKVDERDSLLEQIRNKSFNLKPAAVNRPIIRGPKTNLNVAAILEKAHQIRQALAGSDEDDADSWSDS